MIQNFDQGRVAAFTRQEELASQILEENGTLERMIVELYRTPMSYEEVARTLISRHRVKEMSAEVVGRVIRSSNLITVNEQAALRCSNSFAISQRGKAIQNIEARGDTAWTEMRQALLQAATEFPPRAYDAYGNEMLQLEHTEGSYKGRPNFKNIAKAMNDVARAMPELFGNLDVDQRKCRNTRTKFRKRFRERCTQILVSPYMSSVDDLGNMMQDVSGTHVVEERTEASTIHATMDMQTADPYIGNTTTMA